MLIALIFAAAAQPLPAAGELLPALGPLRGAPGAWVEYLVRSRAGAESRIRVTLLAGAPEGQSWLEIVTADAEGIAASIRLLVSADRPTRVERMFVMLAGQQPVEVPLGRAGTALPAPAEKRLGTRRVNVPAGTFVAEVVDLAASRIWRSEEVPVWGVVQARLRGRTLELLASGRGAGRSVFPPGWDAGGAVEAHGNGSESVK